MNTSRSQRRARRTSRLNDPQTCQTARISTRHAGHRHSHRLGLALVCALAGALMCLLVLVLPAVAYSRDLDTSRVVVAGGALTEILYALELQQQIVGVDTTSLYPPAATEHPQVGYLRALSAEGVLSLSPSLVLALTDAGPAEALTQPVPLPSIALPPAVAVPTSPRCCWPVSPSALSRKPVQGF